MKPIIVILALLAVIGHVLLSSQRHVRLNEKLLQNAVQPGLSRDFPGVSIKYAYLDGFLEGRVASLADIQAAKDKAGQLKPAGRVFSNLKVGGADSTVQRSARFSARLSEGRLVLNGLVPSREIGAEVEAAALKLRNRQVTNLLEVDTSASGQDWMLNVPIFLTAFFEGADYAEMEVEPNRLILHRTPLTNSAGNQLAALANRLGLPIGDLEVDVPAEENTAAAVSNSNISISPVLIDDRAHRVPVPAPKVATNPPVKPEPEVELPEFGFALARSGKVIELTGGFPQMAMKKRVLNSFKRRFPDHRINDKVTINPQIPMPEWGYFIPDFVASVDNWNGIDGFSFDDGRIDLAGVSNNQRRAISDLVKLKFGNDFPIWQGRVRVVSGSPASPKPKALRPARLRASLSPELVQLEGEVADKLSRDVVVRGATKAYPKAELRDEIAISPDVFPAPWLNGFGKFMGDFSVMAKQGEIVISDREAAIRGLALGAANHNRLLALLGDVIPVEIQILDQMSLGSPVPGKQAVPDFPTFVVFYQTGSSSINAPGKQQIKKAVSAVSNVGGSLTVLVKGFADSQGDAEANKKLSERRAQEVVDSLVAQGVNRAAIRYVGVGESESLGGANQNDRRVEVIVVPGR